MDISLILDNMGKIQSKKKRILIHRLKCNRQISKEENCKNYKINPISVRSIKDGNC